MCRTVLDIGWRNDNNLRCPALRLGLHPAINSAWHTADDYESPFDNEPLGAVRFSKEILAQLLNERGYTRAQQVRMIQDIAALEPTDRPYGANPYSMPLWHAYSGEIRLIWMAHAAVDLALGRETNALYVPLLLHTLSAWHELEEVEEEDEQLLNISVSQFSHLVAEPPSDD
tara:strand:- start:172 stop:687 length:516 start_codon:yes stop_codon:yes gene_type:complete